MGFREHYEASKAKQDARARARLEKIADQYEAPAPRRTKPGEMMIKVSGMARAEVLMVRGWDYVEATQVAAYGAELSCYRLRKVHPG